MWTAAILVIGLIGNRAHRPLEHRILFAADKPRHFLEYFELKLTSSVMAAEATRAGAAQDAVPAGEPVLQAVMYAYPYDFHRNSIYIADCPGMAGWAPGIPVGHGPDGVRSYLLSHGIHYFFFDRRLTHNNEDIGDFLKQPVVRYGVKDFLTRPVETHVGTSWRRMEDNVSRDVRHNLFLLAQSDDAVYDDGNLVAVRLNPASAK